MSKLLQRLTDAARSGVYRTPEADALEEVLNGADVDTCRIALEGALAKEEILDRLARALGFPDWFGGNWDAAEDCLTDLSWRAPRARVVLFAGAQPGEALGVLIDILGSAADYWKAREMPFFAVFIDPNGVLDLPRLYRPR